MIDWVSLKGLKLKGEKCILLQMKIISFVKCILTKKVSFSANAIWWKNGTLDYIIYRNFLFGCASCFCILEQSYWLQIISYQTSTYLSTINWDTIRLTTKLPIFVGENISGKKLAFTMLIDGNVSHKTLALFVNNDFDFTCEYREF